jgi:transcription-repair coupling factor (superfamily II helicase)
VGRHKHRAYCYLLLPTTRTLSEVAGKRLRAIEQFSMLGAGFKIAMRDMEIRGVGNILGPEQSGHIATVGYQMYCQLLEEATHRLRNEPMARPTDTHLEIQIGAQIPKAYVPSDKHRMEIYRRIHRAADLPALDQVEQDLTTAYGELPAAAQTVFELAQIRVALGAMEVQSLKRKGEDLIFTTRHVTTLYERLADAPGSVRLVDSPTQDQPGTVYFRPPTNYLESNATLLAVLRKLLVRPLLATT